MHTHRLVVLALCVVSLTGCARRSAVPAPVPLEPPPLERLQADIDAALRLPGVSRGVWGVVVHSLDRDERLYDHNAQTLLVPASAAKLVSVASAVDAVGWDFQFETALSVSGPLIDAGPARRLLAGDVLVTGTGDPSIGGRSGGTLDAFVQSLANHGISRVQGRIVADDDAVEEPRPALAWAWDDLGYRTGAILGALNYAENRLTVVVTPAAAIGAPATLSVDAVGATRRLLSRVETGPPGSPQMLWPEQRPGEPFLTIAGFIPIGAPPARIQVSAGNPTEWFAGALKTHLIASGIEVAGDAVDVDELDVPLVREAFRLLHVYRSPPLSTIVQPLLKDSINLYAEAVLRLNAAPGEFPTNDAALEGLRSRFESWGIDPSEQQLVDGSGLSRRNVITPRALLAVLARMHDPAMTSPWMTALPVAGVDGTLASRMRGTPAEGNVRAKTGTMSNIRSLAGYVTTRDGERLAFVAIVNNYEGSGGDAHAALDAIAVRLAGFSRVAGN